MGKNKRMVSKNITLKNNMRIFRIFFLILVLNFTFNIVAYASSSTNLIFNSSNLSRTLSYMGSDNISLELELASGNVENRTIKILDKNKNIIDTFWGNRTFNIKKDLYPLTFVLENQTSKNFEVRYKISTSSSSSSSSDNKILDFLSGLKGSVEDLLNKLINLLDNLLSKLINLLDNLLNIIIDKFNTIIDKFNYLIDYLTNVEYLKNSIDNLKNSIDNLNNKFTPSNSVISNLNSLGSATDSLDTISVNFPGLGTFNVFDLSYFSSIIKIIRDLLSAIMWIEFAIFCIRIVVPKFKV